jgi:class 3 adenylate cyclase
MISPSCCPPRPHQPQRPDPPSRSRPPNSYTTPGDTTDSGLSGPFPLAISGLLRRVVERWGGRVAKYMGDACSPIRLAVGARGRSRAGGQGGVGVGGGGRATGAAGHRLTPRVGIATGLVMVGDLIGEGAAREESVVGETPSWRLAAGAGRAGYNSCGREHAAACRIRRPRSSAPQRLRRAARGLPGRGRAARSRLFQRQ